MLTHSIQLIDSSHPPGFSTGCDFSGDIIALGDKAKASGFKVGDAVSSMVGNTKDNGAFQGKTSARYPDNVAYFILLSFRVCRDPSRACRSVIETRSVY
jgi:NADPH:quinone reductase-like Zn-dependent oxidoreductase